MSIKDVRRYSRAIDVMTRKLRKDPTNPFLKQGIKHCCIQLRKLVAR